MLKYKSYLSSAHGRDLLDVFHFLHICFKFTLEFKHITLFDNSIFSKLILIQSLPMVMLMPLMLLLVLMMHTISSFSPLTAMYLPSYASYYVSHACVSCSSRVSQMRRTHLNCLKNNLPSWRRMVLMMMEEEPLDRDDDHDDPHQLELLLPHSSIPTS